MNEFFFHKPRAERKKQLNDFPHKRITSALNSNTHGFEPSPIPRQKQTPINDFNR